MYIGAGLIGQVLRRESKNAIMAQIAYDRYKADSGRRIANFVTMEESMSEAWEFARQFMEIGFPAENEHDLEKSSWLSHLFPTTSVSRHKEKALGIPPGAFSFPPVPPFPKSSCPQGTQNGCERSEHHLSFPKGTQHFSHFPRTPKKEFTSRREGRANTVFAYWKPSGFFRRRKSQLKGGKNCTTALPEHFSCFFFGQNDRYLCFKCLKIKYLEKMLQKRIIKIKCTTYALPMHYFWPFALPKTNSVR